MKRLLTIEKVAVGYAVLTSLLMAVLWTRLVEPWAMVQMRVEWLVMTVALVLLGSWVKHRWDETRRQNRWAHYCCQIADLARVGGQLAWLLQWYPDIYEFNRIRPNLDHLFAAADQGLFGCQPSITFSQYLTGGVWSELFNLGYWSYFPMIAVLVATLWWKDSRSFALSSLPIQRESCAEVSALILASFFIYYLFFLLLPVAGPQFYFQAVGIDEIMAGHFPALGTWFSSHTEMLPSPGNADGFFYQLVTQSQTAGERPIAAFPSSHVGLSTIVLLLAYRHVPRLLGFLLPFWFLLCCATVYIQAHYLVDVIAGLITAPLVLFTVSWLLSRSHKEATFL